MPNTISSNGGWIQTIIGTITAIIVTSGAIYTVVINPQTIRIEKLEAGREKDGDQLAKLYTSIQTNDEYKKIVATDFLWVRSDITKNINRIDHIENEQSKRTNAVATIAALQARLDRLERRNEEQDRRSAPTIIEEVKTLRTELDSLRQRIMVPITSK